MNDTKEYNSRMYIGGRRLYDMRKIADGFFGESLIDIYIEPKENIFIVKIEASVSIKQIKTFSDKYKLCRIIPFKQISLKDICKECK